jgi:Fe-S-cluster containining protein
MIPIAVLVMIAGIWGCCYACRWCCYEERYDNRGNRVWKADNKDVQKTELVQTPLYRDEYEIGPPDLQPYKKDEKRVKRDWEIYEL